MCQGLGNMGIQSCQTIARSVAHVNFPVYSRFQMLTHKRKCMPHVLAWRHVMNPCSARIPIPRWRPWYSWNESCTAHRHAVASDWYSWWDGYQEERQQQCVSHIAFRNTAGKHHCLPSLLVRLADPGDHGSIYSSLVNNSYMCFRLSV